MSWQAIKNGIVTEILTLSKPKAVYDYEEVKPAGYPAITVTPTEGNGEFLDTSRTRRNYGFTVSCYQERLEQTPAEAERILTALVDQIIELFDSENNSTLQHSALFVTPISQRWGYTQVPDADVRVCSITLEAVTADSSPFPYEPITDSRYNPIYT